MQDQAGVAPPVAAGATSPNTPGGVGVGAGANDEDTSCAYESDCAVADTPQQQQYKRPSGTAVLDKENGTMPPLTETVLSPMRSAVMGTDMSTPSAFDDSNNTADGGSTVAGDRSVSTFGTVNSRTQLLPASAGGAAGWSSSAPSTPISGHSHPATNAATAASAVVGFGGKKKTFKGTTPTRGSGPILSPAGAGSGGTLGPSGGASGSMLSRIGAKLGRKRPSSTSSASMGGSASEGMHHFSPSTPIQDGGMNSAAATAAAGAPHPSVADEFTLNRRNSGMPDVNSFPLGADGKRGGGSGSGSGGGLLRFKTKGGKIPSRKLNLPSTSVSALSAAVGMSGSSAHEEAGLLDEHGKPTDTSLDMDDTNDMAASHAAHITTSPGAGGRFGGADFRPSPPRYGGFSPGIGVHSSLTAAAAAAAAATVGANCPLTPTESHARHSLPPAAALNTPPASSPSPLFVSAKKIGSEIRQRHGAKRRKGSNRRAKKARRSLRAAQKAAEAAGASSDSCGTENADGSSGNISVPGGPRRLAEPSDRDDDAKAPPSSGVAGSKPVSVDDSFSSADSSLEGGKGQGAAEGCVSKSLGEMVSLLIFDSLSIHLFFYKIPLTDRSLSYLTHLCSILTLSHPGAQHAVIESKCSPSCTRRQEKRCGWFCKELVDGHSSDSKVIPFQAPERRFPACTPGPILAIRIERWEGAGSIARTYAQGGGLCCSPVAPQP